MLALYLFGSPRMELDGVPVHIPRRKALALLAYLVVEGNRPHRRESLFTLLWPGMPEKSARHVLSQTLYALRQVFPDLEDPQGDPVPILLVDSINGVYWRCFPAIRTVRRHHPAAGQSIPRTPAAGAATRADV